MSKKTKCNKKRTVKDTAAAKANTLLRKQLRLFSTCKKQPDNHVALDAFIQAVYPETVKHWLERVKP